MLVSVLWKAPSNNVHTCTKWIYLTLSWLDFLDIHIQYILFHHCAQSQWEKETPFKTFWVFLESEKEEKVKFLKGLISSLFVILPDIFKLENRQDVANFLQYDNGTFQEEIGRSNSKDCKCFCLFYLKRACCTFSYCHGNSVFHIRPSKLFVACSIKVV